MSRNIRGIAPKVRRLIDLSQAFREETEIFIRIVRVHDRPSTPLEGLPLAASYHGDLISINTLNQATRH
jgi:hypothetical protein